MNWKIWIHGLAATTISAAATAVTVTLLAPEKFKLPDDLFLLGKVSLGAGIYSAACYLKKSPVPQLKPPTNNP